MDGHQQKTMSTTIYFKGGFPADVLYEEGISKLNYEGLDLEELKINWKKYIWGFEFHCLSVYKQNNR